ncbi:unnamed protein product, partial [Polarella glacialis]
VGKLVFLVDSKEYKAMRDAASDAEAKSILYLLLNSEPCPRCGMRVQRDGDSAGCPNVVCPACTSPFRCFAVSRKSLEDDRKPSAADRVQLCRLVSTAAGGAENVELDRKRVASEVGHEAAALQEAFDYISARAASFDAADLRRAFLDEHVPVSEKELDLIWNRYAPGCGDSVSFEDFAKQLRYEPLWSAERCSGTDRLLRAVLQAVLRQAAYDAKTEDAKALIPKGCPLPTLFGALDTLGKGYLVDTDFWSLLQEFQSSTSFDGVCTMVHEVQLRRKFAGATQPGRVSVREFGTMIFPAGSKEHRAACGAASDAEAKSALYLTQNSVQCPKCGLHAQRDTNSAGCPMVKCLKCLASFECQVVVTDRGSIRNGWSDEAGASRLSSSSRDQLHRLIATAAHSAGDLENDRIRLSQLLGYDATCLSDVFSFISQGRTSFTLADLRRAMCHLGLPASERELDLLWKRYAPLGEATAFFSDFVRQLKPLSQGRRVA